ncbi:MAG: hypothetical protein MUE41_10795 [Gemmatimonadaceae bacterium]|nr:hypothetical protein [Gemmatimonadaceae bacterium]
MATHCFAVADDRGDADRVALRFEPLRSQRRPDVRGTMWLDRASGALTAVEFAFTGVTYRFFTTGATGRVELATLPSGARFIQSWSIRMPLFGRPGALRRPQQLGWKEDGGEARARVGPPEGEARLAGARERTGVGVGGRRR